MADADKVKQINEKSNKQLEIKLTPRSEANDGTGSNQKAQGQRRSVHYRAKLINRRKTAYDDDKYFLGLSVDDRRFFIRGMGLCLGCLGSHNIGKCWSEMNCGIDGCTQKHHPLLHNGEVETESLCLNF